MHNDRLDSFLRENRPVPPPAPADEFARITAAVARQKNPAPRGRRFLLPLAVAACAAGLVFGLYPSDENQLTLAEQEALVQDFVSDSFTIGKEPAQHFTPWETLLAENYPEDSARAESYLLQPDFNGDDNTQTARDSYINLPEVRPASIYSE